MTILLAEKNIWQHDLNMDYHYKSSRHI